MSFITCYTCLLKHLRARFLSRSRRCTEGYFIGWPALSMFHAQSFDCTKNSCFKISFSSANSVMIGKFNPISAFVEYYNLYNIIDFGCLLVVLFLSTPELWRFWGFCANLSAKDTRGDGRTRNSDMYSNKKFSLLRTLYS